MCSEEKQQSPPISLFTSLPEEIVKDIIARVPIYNYPTLSLVSNHFRSLVASPELYTTRSLLSCTQHCIYVALHSLETRETRLFTLFKKPNNNRLVLIPSLPPIPYEAKLIPLGSKMYVLGGVNSKGLVMRIDSTSHTLQTLPSLPYPVNIVAADVIDNKIYVMLDSGDVTVSSSVVVFDTETEMWEPGLVKPDIDVGRAWPGCVVMGGKIYMGDCRNVNCFYYEPKEGKWEMEKEMVYFEKWMYACVVEDVLYYYDCRERGLRGYDRKDKCWRVVRGVVLPRGDIWMAKTVGCGRKLAVIFPQKGDSGVSNSIWCAEIALEKRQGGEWSGVRL